uniref:Uncharacterized protein n=1 Tax=Mycosarcoma maydis TaxID=5270 RepID=G3CJY5_MYCMD|nr:hypothetical protein um01240 [Ustilago maydis]AEN25736.1 hypothetical protein um01240 [Ustilago maydis]AEN25746.1 hypothetical protein um01240 [Ustilago maydis]AEN25816.1 hypothetical protein um01240 [Ustilago maydis]
MRLILLAAALFGLALSHAQPLLRLFGQDIEVGLEHQRSPEQAVPDARGSRAAAYEQLVEHVVRKEGTGSSGPASSGDIIRFSHSPSSAFRSVLPAHETQLIPSATPPDTPGSTSIRLPSPQIDLDLSNLRKVPFEENQVVLPKTPIYLRPPWFDKVFDRMLSTLPNHRVVVFPEVKFSSDEISQFEARAIPLIVRGEVYKLPIPNEWLHEAGIHAPTEVLARYHSKFTMRERTIFKFVSLWITADGGSKLALLGAFHLSKPAWGSLVTHHPGMQRIDAI